jgi:transposase
MKYLKNKIEKKDQKTIVSLYVNKKSTIDKITKKYKISPNTIYKLLKINNIKLKGNKLSLDIQKKIIKLYKQGNSIKKIKKIINVCKSSVITYLKIHRVKTRKEAGRFKTKYRINLNIFKINSKEKAQFLGLIYADGSLSACNNSISIRLREDDRSYLNDWRTKLLKTKKPLYTSNAAKFMISPKNNKKYKITKGMKILDIVNKKIYEDAISLGLCPNKTKKNIGIPKINKKYINYFILGLFEGDGSIVYSKKGSALTIACQEKMAEDLFNYFRSIGIRAYNYKEKFCNIVKISNQKDLRKIYLLFYRNKSKVLMQRKYDKFTKMITFFDNKFDKIKK